MSKIISNRIKKESSVEEARDFINSYDLTFVINRLVDTELWSKKHALSACEQYKRFLLLMKKYAHKYPLAPSYEIDEAWHAHILHTEKYIQFCNKIFGKYLHHYPHLVHQKGNIDDLSKLFQRTQELHRQEFGYPIYQIKSSPISTKKCFRTIRSFLKGGNING